VRRHYYSSNQEDAVAMRYEITSALPVDRF